MTQEAKLKKQLDVAVRALEEIDSRRSFGPGVAEIALEQIKRIAKGDE